MQPNASLRSFSVLNPDPAVRFLPGPEEEGWASCVCLLQPSPAESGPSPCWPEAEWIPVPLTGELLLSLPPAKD